MDASGQCAGGSRALIFDIQRCSLHDGPGIRTTVFVKGCPLRCLWCHNPEALSFDPQWMDGASPGDSGRMVGHEVEVGEILRILELDRPYFESSGGGLTISGGEPMSHFEFTMALLREARQAGFSTCLDTSGEVSRDRLAATLPLVDIYHYDYKATGPDLHRALVGTDGKRSLENLGFLARSGADIILRCPMIPGVNDSGEHLSAIARIAADFPGIRIEILPYHDMARDKRRRLHMPEVAMDTHVPEPEDLRRWREALDRAGISGSRLLGPLSEIPIAA